MNRRLFIGGLGAYFIVSLSSCHRRNNFTYSKIKAGETVVALGDSLTFGYGASKQMSYPERLAKKTGWKVINAGVNGDTTANVLARLEGVVQQKPKLVLLSIGGNDVLRRIDSAVTKDNLLSIIHQLHAHDIIVVLIAQPHFSPSALIGKASDNPIYKQVAGQTDIPLFSKSWSRILSDDSLKSDQIHANDAGYALFVEELYQFLQQLGLA